MLLQDKVVIITGSSSGIGRAVALRFAGEGYRVVINSRQNEAGGLGVVDEVREVGGEAIYVRADLTQAAEVKGLFERAVAAFGRVDILVNNAGAPMPKEFLETDQQYWVEVLQVNFVSCVLCALEAVKLMNEQKGGKIINTSSIRGLPQTGRAGIMAYSAAKAAMNNFTKTLAKEVAPHITVNAVAPGFVYTPYMDTVSEELKQSWLSHVPLKRFITPEEVADAYLYLASNDIITGEILVADGGFTLKMA